MNKILLIFSSIFFFSSVVLAQLPADQEQQALEKERQELKKELEEKQRLLDNNKKVTKKSLSELAAINSKLDLQERVIKNINRQINLLDNNITRSQRDVHRLSFLLDTLKQEYAKSMIYSYKNRSNADFLNFIFSSSSFNDAIKRINYLKSYRTYREIQGENILRTQGLLRDRIGELSNNKQKKDVALQTQSKEIDALADQQKEKNEVVSKLKAEGKELNRQIAAKKKQMQKVGNAITAAIKRAQDEARKDALAKAAEERKRKETEKNNTNIATTETKPVIKNSAATTVVRPVSILLDNEAAIKLNAGFENNRGELPWPVERGYKIMGFALNELPDGIKVDIWTNHWQ